MSEPNSKIRSATVMFRNLIFAILVTAYAVSQPIYPIKTMNTDDTMIVHLGVDLNNVPDLT